MDKGLELGSIPRDNAAIEANINPALALSGLELLLEGGNSCCRRDGVQRHVDDGGDASEGRSLGTSIESLPFSTAGFVEVDMGIDQAGKQNMGRIVGIRCSLGEFVGGNDRVKDSSDLASATRDDNGG